MSTVFRKYLENFADCNVDKLEYEIGNPEKLSDKKEKEIEPPKVPFVKEVLNPKAIKIAQRESLMWGTHQQKAIEYGNVVHEILSYIETISDVDLALSKAIENGLIVEIQSAEVEETILHILNHPELSFYFSEGNKVMNEQTIIQKKGSPIKPDRMVLSQNKEVFLLDYKTGVHNQKYQLQLETYQNAIEEMGFKVTKKALVYIGEQVNVVNL